MAETRKSLVFLLWLLTLPGGALLAQNKQKESVQQVWVAYANQTRFSDHWGIWADLHLRTREDFLNQLSQSIVRLGLTYYLTDNAKLTAGYAWVNHFPADPHDNISRPEHRPWQQIQWNSSYKKFRMMQWLRLEERWRRRVLNEDELGDGHNFSYRIRYNILTQFPLSRKGLAPNTLSLVINDEVHIGFGREITNYFDQNRLFLGLSYQVNPRDAIQFGYMNVFLQLPGANRYRDIHGPRVFYFHNLDLRPAVSR